MPLLNYTTKVPVSRTIGQVQALKGLYEALRSICEDLGTFRPEFEPDAEERAAVAALARWEAVEP